MVYIWGPAVWTARAGQHTSSRAGGSPTAGHADPPRSSQPGTSVPQMAVPIGNCSASFTIEPLKMNHGASSYVVAPASPIGLLFS